MEDWELETWRIASDASVQFAQTVRESMRKARPKGDPGRENAVAAAQSRLKRSMRPIRSELARISKQIDAAKKDQDVDLEEKLRAQRIQLHDLSDALQRERRKLWKMSKKEKAHGKRRKRR